MIVVAGGGGASGVYGHQPIGVEGEEEAIEEEVLMVIGSVVGGRRGPGSKPPGPVATKGVGQRESTFLIKLISSPLASSSYTRTSAVGSNGIFFIFFF